MGTVKCAGGAPHGRLSTVVRRQGGDVSRSRVGTADILPMAGQWHGRLGAAGGGSMTTVRDRECAAPKPQKDFRMTLL